MKQNGPSIILYLLMHGLLVGAATLAAASISDAEVTFRMCAVAAVVVFSTLTFPRL